MPGASFRIAAELAEVKRFCTTETCRRAVLLEHLSAEESPPDRQLHGGCGNCDICLRDVDTHSEDKVTLRPHLTTAGTRGRKLHHEMRDRSQPSKRRGQRKLLARTRRKELSLAVEADRLQDMSE